MKKIVLSLLILALAAGVNAQEGVKKRDHEKSKRHHGMMTEKLNLSEDQKAKMKTLNVDFRNKMTELEKNENMSVKEWKSKKEALRNEHKAKIQGLLTADQKAQLDKMKSERKSMHKEGAKGKSERHMQKGDSQARMEKMKTELGLNDDQVAKLEQNRTDMAHKMKAIREDKSLDEAKKKEQMKELMKAQKESMKSILTKDQLNKLEERRKQHTPKEKI